MAAACIFLGNDIFQIMNMVWSDNKINDRHSFNQLALVFLRHAAGDSQKHVRVLVLQLLDFTDFPIHFFFRILADAACIHDDDVCVFHFFSRPISQFFQLSVNTFCVRFIHLASICNRIIFFPHRELLLIHGNPPVLC